MHDSLDALRATLVRMTDDELAALQATADASRNLASGLLAFVALSCEWELARRGEPDLRFDPLQAVTRLEEDRATRAAFTMMLSQFQGSPNVRDMLVAAGDLLGAVPPQPAAPVKARQARGAG